MPDRDQPDPVAPDQPDPVAPTPATVPTLVDDYRRQQEAWRLQASELARLRAEVLTAAEREAATIVTNARAEIRGIILIARRNLLALATQVKTIPNTQDEWHARQALVSGSSETGQPEPIADSVALPAQDGIRTAERLLAARHDLLHVLDDTRPDLELLRDYALVRRLHAEPATTVGEPPPDLHENTNLPREDEPALAAQPPIADVEYQSSPRSLAKILVTGFTLIGLVSLLGALWWHRIEQASLERQKQAIQAAPRSTPPQGAERAANLATPPAASPDATSRASLAPIGPERPSPPPNDTAGPMTSNASRESEAPVASRADSARSPSAVAKAAPSELTTPSVVTTTADGRPVVNGPTPVTETMPEGGAQLTSAAESWLDAYHQHDAGRMASVATRDLKISDQRTSGERPAPGPGNVRRVLEQTKFQFVGSSAILTAKMIEQTDAADQPRQYLSWISQVWIREAGEWRLMEVRIISDAKLK